MKRYFSILLIAATITGCTDDGGLHPVAGVAMGVAIVAGAATGVLKQEQIQRMQNQMSSSANRRQRSVIRTNSASAGRECNTDASKEYDANGFLLGWKPCPQKREPYRNHQIAPSGVVE